MQVVKIFKSRPRKASKEKDGEVGGYFLGFHPDPRWPFSSLNGATLAFVKLHLESFGGKVCILIKVSQSFHSELAGEQTDCVAVERLS